MQQRFAKWIERHGDRAYRLARQLLTNEADAEEAVQEAFLRLWQRRFLMREATVGAWLLRVVRNLCLDRLRKRRYRVVDNHVSTNELHDPDAPPSVNHQRTELARELQSVILRLDERQRAAVILRDVEGFDYLTIARTLNLTQSAVKSSLFRARRNLRSWLRESGWNDPEN